MPRRRTKRSRLPHSWYSENYDHHQYVLYECGCDFNKGWKDGDGTKHLTWEHCPQHKQEIDEARAVMNKVWNGIMAGPIIKRQGDKDSDTFDTAVPPPIPPSPHSPHSLALPTIEEKTK
jgi:hypothetical protein